MGSKFAVTFHGAADAATPALKALTRAVFDLAHPFAAWLADAIEAEGVADVERARLVAEAEAEGARVMGAFPCPARHGHETPTGEIDNAELLDVWPCDSCGGAL